MMIAVGGVVNYKDDDGIVAMMMAAMCHVIIHEFRRRETTRLVHQMLIQLGPRFFIRNKIIGFCPTICGQAMINTMMTNYQVYFLSIISLFFWLPLAVLVMLYAVIAR